MIGTLLSSLQAIFQSSNKTLDFLQIQHYMVYWFRAMQQYINEASLHQLDVMNFLLCLIYPILF